MRERGGLMVFVGFAISAFVRQFNIQFKNKPPMMLMILLVMIMIIIITKCNL